MFAQVKKKKVKQKKEMLEGIFAQNLRLVGKRPLEKRSFLRLNWSLGLGLLIFIGVFLSTDTVGSRLRQGIGMLGETSGPPVPGSGMQAPADEKAAAPPAGTSGNLAGETTVLQDGDPLEQQAENLVQLLQDQPLPPPGLEEAVQVQEYVNLISQSPVPIKQMFGLSVKTIIIDAGHGGEDPGAIGNLGTKEKDITLDIARTLKSRLDARGICRVLLTRQADRAISLKDRTVAANKAGADLFISVHVNFLPGRSLDIVETYYFGPSKNADAMQLAEKENEGSDFSISEYNQIIKKLSNTMKLQESRQFAQSIHRNLYRNMRAANSDFMDYGVKRAPFVVLLGAEMPGVLVEVACLSNQDEERRLRDPSYREDIAKYIEAGILHYIDTRRTDHGTKRADRSFERDSVRRN